MDDSNVYWVVDRANDDGGSVMSVPKTGGIPTTVATVSVAPSRIAINDTNIYWTTCPDQAGDLLTVAKTGGTVTTLDTGYCFSGLVADATRVYYGNYSTYTVWSVAQLRVETFWIFVRASATTPKSLKELPLCCLARRPPARPILTHANLALPCGV